MKGFLHHLFLPRPSNNHRARLLHHSSLLAFILLFFILQISLGFVKVHSENVLGIQFSISENDLLVMTNVKRQEAGMSPLSLNNQLTQAAQKKAEDMYAKNYWAHFAPDGSTSPWSFIKSTGYGYTYAGENLARGYTSSAEVIDAWMASPAHKENMLSKNYNEVGFAIVPGMLVGDDTVLVVEMFGSRPEARAESVEESVAFLDVPKATPIKERKVAAVESAPLIDQASLQKNVAFFFLGAILLLLMVDLFIIRRRQVVRIISHNIDEIIFFGFVLTLVIIIGGGSIL